MASTTIKLNGINNNAGPGNGIIKEAMEVTQCEGIGRTTEHLYSLLSLRTINGVFRVARASVYRLDVTLRELTTAQAYLLSMFDALLAEDLHICSLLLDLAANVEQLRSPYLEVWLREDFNFQKDEVRKVLIALDRMELNVPGHILRIFAGLTEKYGSPNKPLDTIQVLKSNGHVDDNLGLETTNVGCFQQTSEQTNIVPQNGMKMEGPQNLLSKAVLKGELETVLKLLDSGADPLEIDGHYGNTGMHWAVRSNNIQLLEIYKERGLDFTVPNNIGWAPIHIAASVPCLKSLVWLLDKGCDVESRDNSKQTPLHKAAFKGQIFAINILLSYGASPNSKDFKSHTPLTLAILNSHIDAVQFLFKRGAELNHVDTWGRSYLHMAKSLPLVKWLIEQNVDMNRKDDWGRTPLHDAVQASNLHIASFLIEKGADIEAQDRNGCTPFYESAKTGKLEFVKLFLKKGADLERTAKDGSTPAEVASEATIKDLLMQKSQTLT